MGIVRVDYYRKYQLDLEHHFENFTSKEAPGLLNHQLQTIIDRINEYIIATQDELAAIRSSFSNITVVESEATPIRFIRNTYASGDTLTPPSTSYDGQLTIYCLVNSSSSEITITLSDAFRSAKAFPTSYATTTSTTAGLDILESA